MTFQPDAFQPDAFQGEIDACDPSFQDGAFQVNAFQVCPEPEIISDAGTASLIGGARGQARKIGLPVGGGVTVGKPKRVLVKAEGHAFLVGSASGTSLVRAAGERGAGFETAGSSTQRALGSGGGEVRVWSIGRAIDAGSAVLRIGFDGSAVVRDEGEQNVDGSARGAERSVWAHIRDDEEVLLLV